MRQSNTAEPATDPHYMPLDEYLEQMHAKGYMLQKDQAAALAISVTTVSEWVNEHHKIPARYRTYIRNLPKKPKASRG